LLEILDLRVKYEAIAALDGFRAKIPSGAKTAIIGPNGAGKSTLFKAIAGVAPASSGSVAIDGLTVTPKTLRAARKKIGILFQNPDDQLFMPVVYDDIAFSLRAENMPESEVEEKVGEILRRFGAERLAERRTHKLSGGEKRLVALAGVLVRRPSLLLLDEPTSGLDPRARRTLVKTLSELSETMLVATHDLDMAAALCGSVIFIREGRAVASGGAELLRDGELLERCGL
jgi:cobalt/nickel transport system ATP-binding protein